MNNNLISFMGIRSQYSEMLFNSSLLLPRYVLNIFIQNYISKTHYNMLYQLHMTKAMYYCVKYNGFFLISAS